MKKDDGHCDAKWVSAFQKGDSRAFNRLYQRYERPLFGYLLRMLGNRQQAEDVFQQTWMKAIKALPHYREQQRFGSWLFGIGHHAAIDEIRKKNTQTIDEGASALLEQQLVELDTPETVLLSHETQHRLHNAIARLPVAQKSVVMMRLNGGLSFKEIADLEKCSINTVLGRMHYAIKNLKKMLLSQKGEDLHVMPGIS